MKLKNIVLVAIVASLGIWGSVGIAAVIQHVMTLQGGEEGTTVCINGPLESNAIDENTMGHVCHAASIATYTPVVGPTAMPTLTPGTSGHPNEWHVAELGGHEHHDEPPTWATDFSWQEFGHGIIYGGNETSSPMENLMKHNVFKGVTLHSAAGGEYYWRYHAGSNPMDRSAQYHSYELYYKDAAGGISFFEGWYDTGDPNSTAHRCNHDVSCPSRPVIISPNEANWANNKRCEQWYPRTNEGGRGLDFAISICQSTVFYHGPSENATAHDMSTWPLTGAIGNIRGGGTTDVIIHDRLANLPPGRHCATFRGAVGSCGDGFPMIWVVSDTIQADLRPSGFGFSWIKAVLESSKMYPCPGCVVPN